MRFRLFPIVLMLLFVTFTLRLGDFIAELASGRTPHLQSSQAFANEEAEGKGEEKKEEGTKKDQNAKPERQEIPAKSKTPPKEVEAKGIDEEFSNGYSDEELNVLQSLSKRRDQLEQRESDLDQREKLLKAAEKKVDEKVAEMEALKQQIETLLEKQHKMQDSRLEQLVKIYENMKPKDAAKIFNEMEFTVLLEIIDRMSERKVAPVLAAMEAPRAREISARLAEQRALPKQADEAAQ